MKQASSVARGFLRGWLLAAPLTNILGVCAFVAFLFLTDFYAADELGVVLGNILVILPVPLLVVGTLALPRLPRFRKCLAALEGKLPIASEEVRWAQGFYFQGPRFALLGSILVWFSAGSAVIAAAHLRLGLSLSSCLQAMTWQMLFGAPISAILCMLAIDQVMRRTAGLLFPDGVLSTQKYRSVSVLTRFTLFALIGSLVPQLLLALAIFGRAGRILHSPHPSVELSRLVQIEFFLLAVGVVLLFAMVAALSGAVSKPLGLLTRAFRQLESGDLSIKVPVESNDALGYLAERFNLMVESLREREFMRQLFGRYVSNQVASEVLSGRIQLGGERRVVSVLFSDIRSFTSLSEQLEPKLLVELLNRYFARMVGCVTDHGGMVNKFLGDGMMAVFGAPVAHLDHAERALGAALAMLRELDRFNAKQSDFGGPELRIGVGIATGEVVVGNVGSEDRSEYTAIGDTVNVASRLEGLTKEANTPILIDASTYHLVKARYSCRSLGRRSVRGKAEPLEVFSPVLESSAVVAQVKAEESVPPSPGSGS